MTFLFTEKKKEKSAGGNRGKCTKHKEQITVCEKQGWAGLIGGPILTVQS